MSKLFELFIIASSVCPLLVASPSSSRIIGGVPVSLGEFPFVVTIQLSGSHICGGLIYNERWVLTSASCIQGYISSHVNQSVMFIFESVFE